MSALKVGVAEGGGVFSPAAVVALSALLEWWVARGRRVGVVVLSTGWSQGTEDMVAAACERVDLRWRVVDAPQGVSREPLLGMLDVAVLPEGHSLDVGWLLGVGVRVVVLLHDAGIQLHLPPGDLP